MANLLNVYNEMVKEASANYAPEQEAYDPRTEVLEKYASLSNDLLANEFGNDYDQNDIVKLAQMMINHDIEQEEAMEKVAEYYQAGVIMAEGFKQGINS